MVQLKGYRINSITFENRVQSGTELQLNNQVKYNINYKENENVCLGMLDFAVSDANMKPFEIRIQLVAEFSYEEGTAKEDVHVESFDQVFPFVRQTISNITTMSGMPALMIPIMKLDRNSVKHGKAPASDASNNNDEGMLN